MDEWELRRLEEQGMLTAEQRREYREQVRAEQPNSDRSNATRRVPFLPSCSAFSEEGVCCKKGNGLEFVVRKTVLRDIPKLQRLFFQEVVPLFCQLRWVYIVMSCHVLVLSST